MEMTRFVRYPIALALRPLPPGSAPAGTAADALSIAAPCPRWRPPTLADGDHRLLAFLLGAHRRHPLGAALLNDREAHDDQGRAEEDRRDRVHLDRDAALGGAEDVEGERDRRAGVEVRDHEVVDRERERKQGARDDAGEDQGEGHSPEGLNGTRPEVLGGLLEA